MKTSSLFMAVVAGLAGSAATASVVQGPIMNPANGHSYSVLSPKTWLNNEAEATTLGGHLVTVNNADENAWLTSTFSNYGPFFIGMTDQQTEGSFVWISGEKDAYRNWGAGEPNDNLGQEDFGLLYANDTGLWNDGRMDHIAYGIVEVVPEPAAAVPIAAGICITALLVRRNRAKPGNA